MFHLKSRKGSILVYVLIFYLFFLSWFHISLQKYMSTTQNNLNLKAIDENLELERQAISILKSSWPIVPEPQTLDDKTISYQCEDDNCHVSISGDINYSFIYAIIEK